MSQFHHGETGWYVKYYDDWERICLACIGQKQYNITRCLPPYFKGIYTLAMKEKDNEIDH